MKYFYLYCVGGVNVASFFVLALKSSLFKYCCTFAWIIFTDNRLHLPCRRTWGQGDCHILEDSSREISWVLGSVFTAFDGEMICSTSPGICKGLQTSTSSRASYLKPLRALEACAWNSALWQHAASQPCLVSANSWYFWCCCYIFTIWWLSIQFNNSQLVHRGVVLWVVCLGLVCFVLVEFFCTKGFQQIWSFAELFSLL